LFEEIFKNKFSFLEQKHKVNPEKCGFLADYANIPGYTFLCAVHSISPLRFFTVPVICILGVYAICKSIAQFLISN
jgi:hypothetical protein